MEKQKSNKSRIVLYADEFDEDVWEQYCESRGGMRGEMMANCEKCIHSNVCKHRVQYVSVGAKIKETTHDCEYFKDKSEVVGRFELSALRSDIKDMSDKIDKLRKQESFYRMENNKLSTLLNNERELNKFLSMRLENETKKVIKEFAERAIEKAYMCRSTDGDCDVVVHVHAIESLEEEMTRG